MISVFVQLIKTSGGRLDGIVPPSQGDDGQVPSASAHILLSVPLRVYPLKLTAGVCEGRERKINTQKKRKNPRFCMAGPSAVVCGDFCTYFENKHFSFIDINSAAVRLDFCFCCSWIVSSVSSTMF